MITLNRLRLLLSVAGILLLLCVCTAGNTVRSWPTPEVSKSYHKINCKSKIFWGERLQSTIPGKHPGDAEHFFSLKTTLPLLTPQEILLWVKVPHEKFPPKGEERRVETKLKGTQNSVWFWKPEYWYLQYCSMCLSIFIFAYGLPILTHYCLFIHVFTSSYVFSLADTAKAKKSITFWFALRPVCLHKPRLTSPVLSEERETQNIWDPWWRMWQGKAYDYVVISQGFITFVFHSKMTGRKGDKAFWNPSFWVIHH